MLSSDGAIMEGLLCPICMQDLGTVAQLQRHFDDGHSGMDKVVMQQLKDLFGKAKKKILREDQQNPYEFEEGTQTSSAAVASVNWDPQELGVTRNHLENFRRLRDARIDSFVVETNKLIIRLDKLVSSDAPSDPGKRKSFERQIVPWAPDNHVNLCPSCGQSFRLTRRRHHCRLCGGIMCNKCSQFLPFSYGHKLTNPGFQYEGEIGFIKRSSSSSSLNSIMSADGEPHIRTCSDCRLLLERRDQAVNQRNTSPFLVQLYDKLKVCIGDADYLLPEFHRISESLNAGEASYGLAQAHELRNKIMHLFDSVDSLSKRIATLGLDGDDLPLAKQLQLQRMIQAYSSQYLRDNMFTLQNLPTDSEYDQLKSQRDRDIQNRLAQERRIALESRANQQRNVKSAPERGSQRKDPTVLHESGWLPYELSSRPSEDDPMVLQMNIIRDYIRQARQARKFDEVRILEENLRDLQQEYYSQVHGLTETSSPVA